MALPIGTHSQERDLANARILSTVRVRTMLRYGRNERGAALVTVLLFMTLTFILISTMLATSSNEVIISSLQRDGVRAMDLAQAGVQEAIRRLEAGRPVPTGTTFTSSLNSGTTVLASLPVANGPNSAYRRLTATATAGKATRRLNLMVLVEQLMFPPNMFMGDSLHQPGNPNQLVSGDVYSRSFVQYQSLPPNSDPSVPPTMSYAGWRMSMCNDVNCSGAGVGEVNFCYTPGECTTNGAPSGTWFPGRRRSEYSSSATGTDIQAQTTKCPAGGGGTLPTDIVSGTFQKADCNPLTPGCTVTNPAAYGFDLDTRGGVNRAVTPTTPCGLPYKWIASTIAVEDPTKPSQTLLFKTVVFEQWFNTYWQFNEAKMEFTKTNTLNAYPDLGAIPAFPDNTMARSNFDVQLTGGGAAVPPSGQNFGTSSQMKSVWMDANTWAITDATPPTGYGSMVIDGNLNVNLASGGNFEYWGTIIVKGTVTASSGTVIVHGGLIAKNVVVVNGNFTVYGGTQVNSVPVGPSKVVGKAWWEQ